MPEDKPKVQKNPDKDADVAVKPHDPEEATSGALDPPQAHAVGFDPSRPVATSPPPVEMATGVPDLPLLSEREQEAQREDAAASTGGGGTDAAAPDPKKN